MDRIFSSFKFEKYIVEKILLEENKEFNKSIKDTKLSLEDIMDFNSELKIVDDNIKNVSLIVNIGSTGKLPYKLNLILTGTFNYKKSEEDKLSEEEVNYLFEKNAIAILFPYVRALVSTYTSISNYPALTIPSININKFLEEKNKLL